MSVFNEGVWSEVIFDQCNTHLAKVEVYFMRKHIVKESRGMFYHGQEQLVKTEGFEVTPLRKRAILDAVAILASGTFPDMANPYIYARTSDTVVVDGNFFQSIIGSFGYGRGLDTNINTCATDHIGTVPGVSAEAVSMQALFPQGDPF